MEEEENLKKYCAFGVSLIAARTLSNLAGQVTVQMLVPAVATLRDHFVWCANLNAHQRFSYLMEQDNEDICHVFYSSQFVQESGS